MKNRGALLVVALLTGLFCPKTSNAETIIVNANQGTQGQVNQASAGDTILFSPGIHDDIDLRNFVGTECDPTVLMSQDENDPAVLSSNIPGHASLDVEDCEYLIIENLVATAGQTGFDIKLSKHVIMRKNEIRYTGNAGLKIRYRSTHVDFIDNKIHHTGRVQPQYGEGIYLGTAKAKGWEPWGTTAGGDANDTLAHVWIEGNEIYECGNGEGIDCKGDMKYLTIKGNYIHDIYPGVESVQANAGAVSIAAGRDDPHEPAEFWVEENTIEDVYYGQGDPNSHQVAGTGLVTFGGGHYILNNTFGNCEQTAIDFSQAYLQYGLVPYFIYVHGNTINNNWGDDFQSENGGLQNYIHYQDPGFSNPHTSQSWCGDVANNCPQPDLGPDRSICGELGGPTGMILETGVAVGANLTFEWFLNGVSQAGPMAFDNQIAINQAGVWSVVLDSAGVCSNSSEVTIAGVIEAFDLGADEDLCASLSLTLVAGLNNPNYDYSWSKDGVDLGQTSNSIAVSYSGTYTATISATGCSDVSDAIVITSSLPPVMGDTICDMGIASLEAVGATGAEWYDAPTDGNMMGTGNGFSPSITQSSTYYVQAGTQAVTQSTGHTGFSSSWAGTSFDRKIKFTVLEELTVDQVSFDAQGAQTVVVRVLADDNSTVLGQFSKSVSGGVDQINLGITLAPGTYFMDGLGSTGSLQLDDGVTSYVDAGIPGLITYTTEPSWEEGLNRWRYFYNWQVTTGSACVRVPAHAVIDPFHSECLVSAIEDHKEEPGVIYPNPCVDRAQSTIPGPYEILNANGSRLDIQSEINLSEFAAGLYLIRFQDGSVQTLLKE